MPIWSEILKELDSLQKEEEKLPYDDIRRKYLSLLSEKTGRNTILYATSWTQPGNVGNPDLISIVPEDVQGFMEVFYELDGDKGLDLILHSPGGLVEAAEALVSYIRTKFSDVRVIIPHAAMSAATMIACSSNKIIMGKHSSLGPIDPQFVLDTQLGRRAIPAQSIIDQFEMAKDECADQTKLGPWMPILGQYGPGIIIECENATELSEQLVFEWLKSYMLEGNEDKAKEIASYLSDHTKFKTHGRYINREDAKDLGLSIEDLENDQEFQDLVLSIFHATTHTFNGTGAVKIIENNLGRAFIRSDGIPRMPPKEVPKDDFN